MHAVCGFLLVGAMALGAEAAPRGRVVRVERDTTAAVPQRCLMAARLGELWCYGQPRQGDRVAILDLAEGKVRGELVIESVSESQKLVARGECASTDIQVVTAAPARGADEGGPLIGLRGARLDRRTARVLKDVPAPSGRADESVDLAVDADGDGRADLVLTRYACDEHGAPASDRQGRCFDTYMEGHGGLRRVQHDVFRVCH